jgi:hypothetical protein
VCEAKGTGALGATCSLDNDCAPGLGCFDDGTGTNNFVCYAYCTLGTSCPSGSACGDWNDPFGTFGVCG